jgi:hypothetical protein
MIDIMVQKPLDEKDQVKKVHIMNHTHKEGRLKFAFTPRKTQICFHSTLAHKFHFETGQTQNRFCFESPLLESSVERIIICTSSYPSCFFCHGMAKLHWQLPMAFHPAPNLKRRQLHTVVD